MALFGLIRTHAERQAERERRRAQNRRDLRSEQLGESMDKLSNLIGSIRNRANLTAQDRFGDSIQRIEDLINNNAAESRRGLNRALMASGGDITGEGAAALAGITQNENELASNALRHYLDLAHAERRQDLSRAGNLTLRQMRINQNLLGMTNSMLGNRINNEAQATAASNQLFGDILGAGASILGAGL